MLIKNKLAVGSASALLAMSSLLSACGTNSDSGAATPETKKEAPTEISIMSSFTSAEPPDENNVIHKEVERRTNTKLNITWVPGNGYSQKVNITLASGDIPDMVAITSMNDSQFRTMISQGAFWDLTNMIKDYPNLSKYPKVSWDNIKIDGKIYGIVRPRPSVGAGSFPFLRKDWLDNLGLKVPQTMDEMYNVMKAFTYNDPDGNGKQDTIGLAGNAGDSGMGSLAWVENVFNKTNGGFKLMPDGRLERADTLPSAREAILFLQRAYKEKLIPEDFAVLKQPKDLMIAGKAGIFTGAVENSWESMEPLRKSNPKADVLPLVALEGVTFEEGGHFGMFVIPKKVPEAKVRKILAFMDAGATEELSLYANFGEKGVHYEEKEGFRITTDKAKTDMVSQQLFGQIFTYYDKYQYAYRSGMPKDVFERNKKIIDERVKFAVGNPANGITSETFKKVGPEMNKQINDMKVKVIMGKEPIEAWDKFVEQLKANPDFKKVNEEFTAEYKKKMGK